MLDFSDSHRFRKTVAGACMMLAPLFVLVGFVVHPDMESDAAAQLGVIAENSDRWVASHLILLAAVALMVPAVLGLMHMLRERQVAMGHLGGALGLLGLLALAGVVAIELVAGQMVKGGAERGEMVGLLDRVQDTAAIAGPFFVVSFAFALGLIVLAFGLWQAHATSWWMAACIAIGAVLLAIPVYEVIVPIVGAAFLLIGLGSVGRMVLAESVDDWDHTPDYRPAAGLR
jgi:hypothetical protein